MPRKISTKDPKEGGRKRERGGESAAAEAASSSGKKQRGMSASSAAPVLNKTLPRFSLQRLDSKAALDFYRAHQVLHVRCDGGATAEKKHSMLEALRRLCSAGPDASASCAKTWTVENENGAGAGAGRASGDEKTPTRQEECLQNPASFFAQLAKAEKGAPSALPDSTYVSCILQDSKEAVDAYLSKCPVKDPPFVGRPWGKFRHSLPLWLFVGRHAVPAKALNMCGRPEHTDSVTHDGTWHYQAYGEKHWHLRPLDSAAEWAGLAPVFSEENQTLLHVQCKPGDVLMINTRLWWHHTDLPSTARAAHGVSMSLARDFYCPAAALPAKAAELQADGADETSEEADGDFSNIDGIYAKTNVRKGDVVLRESEMPDCALPRSADPNCEVAELEDGEGCLAALRDIGAGEWLSVAPSDSEGDDSDDDDEGGWEEEEEEEEDGNF